LISSIFNKTSEIFSNWHLNCRFNTFSIRNRSINIIKEEEEDIISKRLVKYNCTKCNSKIIDSYIKVIYELRNQNSQISVIVAFDKLFIQEELKADVEEYK